MRTLPSSLSGSRACTLPSSLSTEPGMYPSRLASVAAGHVPSRPASVEAGHVPSDQPQWQPGMYRKNWLLAVRLKRSYAARGFQESCLSLKHSALTWKSSERANCCDTEPLMHFACVVGNL